MTVEGYDLAVQIHPIEVAILLVFWVRRLHFCDINSHYFGDSQGFWNPSFQLPRS